MKKAMQFITYVNTVEKYRIRIESDRENQIEIKIQFDNLLGRELSRDSLFKIMNMLIDETSLIDTLIDQPTEKLNIQSQKTPLKNWK